MGSRSNARRKDDSFEKVKEHRPSAPKPKLVKSASSKAPELPKPVKILTRDQINDIIIEHSTQAQRLARSFLNKWRVKMNPNEVTSVVGMALCEAGNRFDPNRGVAFQTFLFYHLRGLLIKEIKRLIEDSRITQLIPTTGNVDGTVIEQLSLGAWPIAIVENRNPESLMQRKQLSEICWNACAGLDELEREVVNRHFINDQSLVDIAKELGYCRCHISRVKTSALATIGRNLANQAPEHQSIIAQLIEDPSRLKKFLKRKAHKSYTGGRGRRRSAKEMAVKAVENA